MRALVLFLAVGCAAGRVNVPVLRPAEINLVSYKTLGISSLSGGPMAQLVTATLEEQLVRSQRFTIVDRQRIESVMGELQLASTDIADPHNSVKLGGLLTAGALITGDVQSRYVETPHEDKGFSKGGVPHFHRWTSAELTLEANFRLTDVSTGALLVARRYSALKSNDSNGLTQVAAGLLGAVLSSATGQTMENDAIDPPPDRARLEREAVAEVVSKFAAAIQPTSEMREVQFELDDAVPQLQAGLGWAQHGDWRKAQATFNTAIQDSEKNARIGAGTLWKVYFDTAVSYEYGGEPDKALPLLEKAYSLAPGNRRVLDEMESVKRMQGELRQLAEQNAR
ncbi:MAG: CsgG/HfaB family protein [Myxococcales bacterium]|nr:hypothetical protein [Myxococcales bacterium]